jgi:hypothetical protein
VVEQQRGRRRRRTQRSLLQGPSMQPWRMTLKLHNRHLPSRLRQPSALRAAAWAYEGWLVCLQTQATAGDNGGCGLHPAPATAPIYIDVPAACSTSGGWRERCGAHEAEAANSHGRGPRRSTIAAPLPPLQLTWPLVNTHTSSLSSDAPPTSKQASLNKWGMRVVVWGEKERGVIASSTAMTASSGASSSGRRPTPA